MRQEVLKVLLDLLYRHFEAVFGYMCWLFLIVFLSLFHEPRWDELVRNLVPAWMGSLATYISVKAIGLPVPGQNNQPSGLQADVSSHQPPTTS